jgi:predicted phosphoadenosine phosphosulfate sulfurtransferase
VDVYQAAQKRMKFVFDNFDNVCVSFSGGKDSGVLLNLAIDYCRENHPGRRISVFHLDYEAQYQMTTDYVDAELKKNLDIIDVYRVCLPIAAQCATSMFEGHWIPWDDDKKDIWVRGLPDDAIHEGNHSFDWFKKGMWDYELQERFSSWVHKRNKANKTACLVGIRTQESQNRWNAIHGLKKREDSKYEGVIWSTKMSKDVYNMYPIYDWSTEDIWVSNAKFEWSYNKLYDLFQMAGLKINSMRVASPFNDCAIESLKLYKVIDPKNWGRMIGRTNGVNFAGMYGGTTAMGWKSIKLPPGHTWKSYMEFLLTTLPESVADNYKKKLNFSIKFWQEKGGGLPPRVVSALTNLGILHEVGTEARKSAVFKENLPVKMEYLDDIDIDDFRLIPSYKRMCICIIKNDFQCKYMGFGQNKLEMALRRKAENKYSKIIERIENDKSSL